MEWKFLKLIASVVSIIGFIVLLAGGTKTGFELWALFGGIIVFVICRIFEPTIVIPKK